MTQAVRDELEHQVGDDGVFYMTLEQYYDQVHSTTLNYNTGDWHHSYYLALDDDRTGSEVGDWNWCGSSCTRYTVLVTNTSGADNTIHVGAHTWGDRSYPETSECSTATNNVSKYHSLYTSGMPYV